jgi:hypothetical protein
MSNDLVTNLEPRLELEPNVEHAIDRALLRGELHAIEPAWSHPFADGEQARAIVRRLRKLLGRQVEGADLAGGVLLVVATKVLDEARRDADGHRFAAVPAEPRMSASRFDTLVRDTARALADTAGGDVTSDLELPELVAHEVLRQLGPFSVVATADLPGGPDLVRALFAEAIAGPGAGDSSRAVRAFAEVLRRRAAELAPARAAGFGLVSAAAISALADQRATSPTDATRVEPTVVDLRDTADVGLHGSRS